MKNIVRILASPFVLAIILIGFNYSAFVRWINFIKHGGEFINYDKDEKTTIHDIYLLHKEKLK